MCKGPLRTQILKFTIPLVFSGLLQMFFHAADLIVVGRFASYKALAAVGSTGSLTMLIINIFLGMSIGTNVLVARYLGEKNRKEVSRTVHTAILFSVVAGIGLAIFGVIMSRTFLRMMQTPPDVIDMSVKYMRIYFAGMPIILLYNYGSSIMRAAGDTRRPFYFLVIGGIVNVVLNLFFVIVCKIDVGGVALATVISQGVSAFMILRTLRNMSDGCRMKWKNLHISWKNLKEILWLGVPAGFQSSCFSLSNILIQSSLNLFGAKVMAGSAAATQWEGLLFVASTAIGHAMVSFVGQNMGGKQYQRIRKSIKYGTIFSVVFSLVVCLIFVSFRYPMLGMFNSDFEVIKYGAIRFVITLPFHWICAIMEIETGALRGLGHTIGPTIIMIFGICVFRIIWLVTIFKLVPEYNTLIWSFPISWGIVVIIAGIYLMHLLKKMPAKNMPQA